MSATEATLARTETVDLPPAELYLEVTNRCNLKCRMCPQFWGMPEPDADLDLDQVLAIIQQLPRLDRVVLHGVGESVLNPALPEIVAAVRKRGAYTLMNSNGTILTRRRVEGLVKSGLDELRVSIDAASPETYEQVRGANALHKLVRNLGIVQEVRAALGATTPRLSLWVMGLQESLHELPRVVELAAEVKVNEVYLQRLVTSDRGIARSDNSLYGADSEALDPLVEAHRLAVELGVELKGSGDTTGEASVQLTDADAPWRGCRRPWSLMYVTANGNVLPCCISVFTDTPHEELILGNVFDSSVAEVWNGERYRKWRGAMLAGEPPKACKGCGVSWSL
jgi:radical SAM protein with 4Fe4S-binding SPASM domain